MLNKIFAVSATIGLLGLVVFSNACSKVNLADQIPDPGGVIEPPRELKETSYFKSCQEVQDYVGAQTEIKREGEAVYAEWRASNPAAIVPLAAVQSTVHPASGQPDTVVMGGTQESSSINGTNVQEFGIEEDDFAKHLGGQIYLVRDNSLLMIQAKDHKIHQSIELVNLFGAPAGENYDGSEYQSRASAKNVSLLLSKDALVVIRREPKSYNCSVEPLPSPIDPPMLASSMFLPDYCGANKFQIVIFRREVSGELTSPHIQTFQGELKRALLRGTSLLLVHQEPLYLANSRRVEANRGRIYGVPCHQILRPDIEDFDLAMTTLTRINITMPKAVEQLAQVGASDLVYVGQENVYLIKENFPWHHFYASFAPTEQLPYGMRIHQYAWSEDQALRLTAAGAVSGKSQSVWNFKEYDGGQSLALAYESRERDVHFATLTRQAGVLSSVGQPLMLARNENIKSVRFHKDMAYVVTFRNLDPLFVIDMTDRLSPQLQGELKIPGFSAYMHSLAGDRLLGIGFAQNGWGDEAGRGGLQISLFDVGEPQTPLVEKQISIGQAGSSVAVASDPRGFFLAQDHSFFGLEMKIRPYDSDYLQTAREDITGLQLRATKDLAFIGQITHVTSPEKECRVAIKQEMSRRGLSDAQRLFEINGELVSISDWELRFHRFDGVKLLETARLSTGEFANEICALSY